jgi:hypothetical protein
MPDKVGAPPMVKLARYFLLAFSPGFCIIHPMTRGYLTTISVLFCAAAALAQNSSFTYQGRLLDGANPATGLYDITFKLFDQPTDGSQQGLSVPETALPVTNGLFATDLDFGADVFSGASRWLELSVHRVGDPGPFTVLSPRQALSAAPYAIRAAVASSFVSTVTDSQLSTNVVLRNADQSFGGAVQFTSASGNFSGNGSGLTNLSVSGSGVLSGRINQLPTSPGQFYASAQGASSADSSETQLTSLTPDVSGTASHLSVRLDSSPHSGNSYTFILRTNLVDSPLSCSISNNAVTGNSGSAEVIIPPGTQIAIRVRVLGTPNANYALFGWSFK